MKMYIYVDYETNSLSWTVSNPCYDKEEAICEWRDKTNGSCERTHLGKLIELDLPEVIKDCEEFIDKIPVLQAKILK